MAAQNQLIPLTVLIANRSKSTRAVLSVRRARSEKKKKTFWRAVLRVTGEAGRYWGTRHPDAVESTRNLLSRFPGRISAAELNRVLEVMGQGPVPVLDGSQPSLRPRCRVRGKRKINESDFVKNRLDAKEPAIDSKQGPPVADGSADSQTRSLVDHKVRVVEHLWAGARGRSKTTPKKVLQSADAAAAPSSDMTLRKTAPARNIRRRSKSSLSSAAGSNNKKKSTTIQGVQTTEKTSRDQCTQTTWTVREGTDDIWHTSPVRERVGLDDYYVNEMRSHIRAYANGTATQCFLADLPGDVRTFFKVLPR
jgi:hypothetical protein